MFFCNFYSYFDLALTAIVYAMLHKFFIQTYYSISKETTIERLLQT